MLARDKSMVFRDSLSTVNKNFYTQFLASTLKILASLYSYSLRKTLPCMYPWALSLRLLDCTLWFIFQLNLKLLPVPKKCFTL